MERKFDVEQLYIDYLSGEVFEKVLNYVGDYDEFLESYQFELENSLDLMLNLYEHSDFKQAEKIAKDLDLYIDLDFYWGDIFTRVETDDNEIADLIQDLVAFAYDEVQTEEYFKNVVIPSLDETIVKVLSKIY